MTRPATDARETPLITARRIAILLSTFVAGIVGALYMYWTWRVEIGIPLQLSIGLHMDPAWESVRPWAPWWVPTAIMAIITMVLWRILAAHAAGVSLKGGAIAIMIVSYLTYGVAMICLEIGAMMQYVPPPSLGRMLTVMPLVLIEAGRVMLLYLLMGFPIGWIATGLVSTINGMATAAVGRIILRIAERVAQPHPA
jgi:hypothetical protein